MVSPNGVSKIPCVIIFLMKNNVSNDNYTPRRADRPVVILRLVIAVLVLIVLALIYVGIAEHYRTHFLPGTYVNGTNISGMSLSEAAEAIPYTLETFTITNNGETVDSFSLTDIGGEYSYYPQLSEILEDEQHASRWLFSLGRKDYDEVPDITYNETKVASIVENLDCVNDPDAVEPTDAYYAKTDTGFTVEPETVGTAIDADLLTANIKEALRQGQYTVDAQDSLKQPSVTSEDLELTDVMQTINAYDALYIDMSGGVTETIDKATVMGWLVLSEDGEVTVDTSKVAETVAELAEEYNTLGTVRTFTTNSGEKIQVGGSEKDTMGYEMDQETTTERLAAAALTGAPTSARWPVAGFTRTDENDFGDTYVEVSIYDQHLWYYVNGEVVLETDVVTGEGSNSTTPGVFMILDKQSPATLEGTGYSTDVSYWMPITYSGTGLHDATWRTEFGKEIYVSGGSHGCINMPLDMAEELYNSIEMGTPVIVYDEDVGNVIDDSSEETTDAE